MILFVKDLESRGLSHEAALRLLRRAGHTVFGAARCITEEKIQKEFERLDRIKPIHDVQDTPLGQSGGAGDGDDLGTAKEALGLGRKPGRSRRRSKKQNLRLIEGGNRMDASEVCQ